MSMDFAFAIGPTFLLQICAKKFGNWRSFNQEINPGLPSLLELTALIASLIPTEGEQAVSPSQEGKQGIYVTEMGSNR